MRKNSKINFIEITIRLLSCYYLYVNPDYSLFICEIDEENRETLIEVTEGDGYNDPPPIEYDSLVNEFNRVLFDNRRDF